MFLVTVADKTVRYNCDGESKLRILLHHSSMRAVAK